MENSLIDRLGKRSQAHVASGRRRDRKIDEGVGTP